MLRVNWVGFTNGYNRDPHLFLRFVNMLLNDANYLLDESLAKLAEIRTTQQLMANPQQWQAYVFVR